MPTIKRASPEEEKSERIEAEIASATQMSLHDMQNTLSAFKSIIKKHVQQQGSGDITVGENRPITFAAYQMHQYRAALAANITQGTVEPDANQARLKLK
ncbi:hypothetical protein [Candidatus Berkiella aquae]|uniref:Uncharacterized protein n=1 Tax=Candidatus Berkiella aquae TaxID=295108 RepID=A0A0Q9YLU5_9GAMM|nr:hypothetical protein [Candidatus Berkiella aquae]MCS5710566.1 hypothetical protein [Candidatus Berkiella aquae]